MKIGTPITPLTIPIGNSAGFKNNRADRSVKFNTTAPIIALFTINFRLSEPTKTRKICGTINPTKAITPTYAVATATKTTSTKRILNFNCLT